MSVVIFDGTSYFVESSDYELGEGEEIIFKGQFSDCSDLADSKNEEIKKL